MAYTFASAHCDLGLTLEDKGYLNSITYGDQVSEFHPWNVFLFICGLAPFYAGLVFFFLPESPKFLMTIGENEKALKVFQKVYGINTGKSPESFPIKKLVDETKLHDSKYGGYVTANRTMIQALKEGWQQITPLFYPPNLGNLILVCFIQFLTIQSLQMLRLWLPQIFQAIDDYKHNTNGTTAALCTMIDLLTPTHPTDECSVNMDNSHVYINSIIVAVISMGGYGLTGFVINILGKKKILSK
ncbi:hypothetical protein NQ314_019130 [Rhamnusium bicolor]|uniref:Uncharacterized protein n=1 Tax=Rhamnusium bicolor TaxID=1586634 RepID=A0AAV8WPD4_9CUCU|nr:hypothetical protein NQ314_019130 [Rhamnusium bicolor]